MSHSPYTNLGTNQDADSFRDQAVDRERETDDGFGEERRRLMFAEIADNNRRNLKLLKKSNLEEAARRDTTREADEYLAEHGSFEPAAELKMPEPLVVTEATMLEILMPDKFNKTKK